MQDAPISYQLRLATDQDLEAVTRLIEASAKGLGAQDYSEQQIEEALRGAFGLDTQLVADRTYYVVETSGAELAACGGGSFRKTLFGGDEVQERDAETLDPAEDAAKIRAFFVHPEHARRGARSSSSESDPRG